MQENRKQELADLLWNARLQKIPCDPITSLQPGLTVEDAYLISKTNVERRTCGEGIVRVGKKIGLTSKAVQAQLGVHEPDFGYLTSDMLVQNGERLVPRALIQGRVEGEVAFVLRRNLDKENLTLEDVIDATDYIQTCIEIIDSRVRDWKIKIQDTVADNASAAYFVLSSTRAKLSADAIAKAKMGLWINGELRSEGRGELCLDSPVKAALWLAKTMQRLGDSLQAGDIILTGAFGPVVPVSTDDSVRVSIEGIGESHFIV